MATDPIPVRPEAACGAVTPGECGQHDERHGDDDQHGADERGRVDGVGGAGEPERGRGFAAKERAVVHLEQEHRPGHEQHARAEISDDDARGESPTPARSGGLEAHRSCPPLGRSPPTGGDRTEGYR